MARVTLRRFQNDGQIDDPISPDYALPAQLPTRNGQLTPEQRLMMASLEDAVRDLRRFGGCANTRARGIYWETVAWFMSDECWWPHHFVNMCDHLGLEADAVRTALRDANWRPTWNFSRERYAGHGGHGTIRGTKFRHYRAA